MGVKAVDQRLNYVFLTNKIAKSLWAPLARQYLITHRESSDPLMNGCLELKMPSFFVTELANRQLFSALCASNLNILILNSTIPEWNRGFNNSHQDQLCKYDVITITEGMMATPAHRSPAPESAVAAAPFRA